MNDAEILKLFTPLWADLRAADSFPAKRPLLAHYTSVPVLESILKHNEFWLSNPLFMNDLEEVRFGLFHGSRLFSESSEIQAACGSQHRFDLLKLAFNDLGNAFANEHVLDLYVFCLSEHDKDNTDGVLSMWRAYGGNWSRGGEMVCPTTI